MRHVFNRLFNRNSNLRVVALVLLLGVLLPGCRLQVVVPQGGMVESTLPPNCFEQTTCVFEIEDATFTSTFTAVPDNGWVFLRWSSGDDFLCADSTDPVCGLSNVLLAGNAFAESIIASTKSYYLVPIFEQLQRDITDTIVVPGVAEFAQPDLFKELTWNEIRTLCPSFRSFQCEGVLNGWDMTGWTWSDAVLVNTLFNTYGVNPPLNNFPDGRAQNDSVWAPAFFNAGWRPVTTLGGADPYRDVQGWIRDEGGLFGNGAVGQMRDGETAFYIDIARTNNEYSKTFQSTILGAWFHRPLPP